MVKGSVFFGVNAEEMAGMSAKETLHNYFAKLILASQQCHQFFSRPNTIPVLPLFFPLVEPSLLECFGNEQLSFSLVFRFPNFIANESDETIHHCFCCVFHK
jgi:hypothetical protein